MGQCSEIRTEKELGACDWGFLRNVQTDLSSGKWKDGWLGNLNGAKHRYVLRVSVGNFGMETSSVTSEGIWLETVRVICWGHQMEDCLGGH